MYTEATLQPFLWVQKTSCFPVVNWINQTRSLAYCLDPFKTTALSLGVSLWFHAEKEKCLLPTDRFLFFFFFCTMSKEASTLPLLANSPIRPSLQHLVQNHTLWTAPIIILLFALFVRWSVALNPYSGRFITFITRLLNSLEKKKKDTTHHPCMVITKPRDIGWRLRCIYLFQNGILMICSGGDLTIPL